MSDADIARATGIPLAFVAGIRATESGGNPRAVRFEPHLFRRALPEKVVTLSPTPGAAFVTADDERRDAWARGLVPYTPGRDRAASASKLETGREAFTIAYQIDAHAAVRSTSWGSFQVLGGTLLALYPGPARAVAAFDADPAGVSDALLIRYLRDRPAVLRAAKRGDVDMFIHYYNGCPIGETGRYRVRFDPAYLASGGTL